MDTALVTIVIPISLGIIMFGMGFSLTPDDFYRVARRPRSVAVGLFGQILVLPALAFTMATFANIKPEHAVGLMILAACAGGPISNTLVFLAKAELALSVTLTAVGSCITIFTIPLIVNFALQEFMGYSEEQTLPIGSTNLKLFAITLFPVLLGMYFRKRFATHALKINKLVNRLATGFFVLLALALVFKERANLESLIVEAGAIALALNCVSMIAGFVMAKLAKLDRTECYTISIEVGVQNCATGMFIGATLLGSTLIATASAIYPLAMFFTAGVLIVMHRKTKAIQETEEPVTNETLANREFS